MKPYLIVAHNYTRTSAGVRALHYLAHCINVGGGQAYVAADVVNPVWDTPKADDALVDRIARNGVVVYPEVEEGNPLGALRIARFVLNIPGYIRGKGELEPFGACFHYVPMLARYAPSESHVLTVPIIDLDLFYTRRGIQRSGSLLWTGKGFADDMPQIWDADGIRQIVMDWPQDWDTLAALFQTSDMLYSYTDYTAIVTEARLCGCAAVVIPSGHFSKEAFCTCPGGLSGLAWGSTYREIVRALSTVSSFYHRYKLDMSSWDRHLDRFVEITQGI